MMSAYCRPSRRDLDFDEMVGQAKQLAGNRPFLVLGDFNAPHTTWGYKFQSKRGKALAKTMEDLELALLNEPGVATRREPARTGTPSRTSCGSRGLSTRPGATRTSAWDPTTTS